MVLLNICSTLKTDAQCFVVKLVYGTSHQISGEFFVFANVKNKDKYKYAKLQSERIKNYKLFQLNHNYLKHMYHNIWTHAHMYL